MESQKDQIDLTHYLDRWTLIIGDVNTGKTTLSRRILRAMCVRGLGHRITVLDLAPVIPAQLQLNGSMKGVGGRLEPDQGCNATYLFTELRPPRLSSRTDEEAVAIAEENRLKIEKLLSGLDTSRTDIVFINDVTLYLQAARAADLLSHLAGATTVVANGYHGTRLGTGTLSQRERAEMQVLSQSFGAFKHTLAQQS